MNLVNMVNSVNLEVQKMSRIRELLLLSQEIKENIPYQKISDSPTIKLYTNWKEYDKYIYDPQKHFIDPLSDNNVVKKIAGDYDLIYYKDSLVINKESRNFEVALLERKKLFDEINGDSIEKIFTLINPETSKIYAKHIADISSVMILRLFDDLNEPIKIYVGGCFKDSHLSQHLVVITDKEIRSSLLLYIDPPDNCMRSFVAEYFISKDSEINLAVVNIGKEPSYYSNNFMVDERGKVNVYSVSVGGYASRFENRAYLSGEEASYQSLGFSLSRYRDWIHIPDIVHLYYPRGSAHIDLRGVALDESKNILQGYAKQHENSTGSRAHISVFGINLGEKSLLVTTPFIDVLNGNVEEASHESSQYTLDPDTEFYLRSRGIEKREAIKLIIGDFVEDYLLKIPAQYSKYFRKILGSLIHI